MLYMICPPFVLRKRLLRDSLRTMVSVDLAAACAWHMVVRRSKEKKLTVLDTVLTLPALV